jgi:hypothetical protein
MSEIEIEEQGAITSELSPMGQIRQRQAALQSEKTKLLEIEPYDGMLFVEYRTLDVQKDLQAINTKVSKEAPNEPLKQAFLGALDTMARACVGIFYNRAIPGEEPDLVSIAESISPDEPPVRYDERLAEFLAMPDVANAKARDVILFMFGGKELLILGHNRQLVQWMTGSQRGAQEELAGEI